MSLTLLGAGQVGRAFVKIAAGQQQEALRVIDTRPPEDTVAFLSRDSQYPRAGIQRSSANTWQLGGTQLQVEQTNPEQEFAPEELVVDCTGTLHDNTGIAETKRRGAERILLSSPAWQAHDSIDLHLVQCDDQPLAIPLKRGVISAASCTTTAAAPFIALFDAKYGVERVQLTTMHSVMNDQPAYDRGSSYLERSFQAIVPIPTTVDRSLELIFPHLEKRIHARAFRVPVWCTCAMDVTLELRDACDLGMAKSVIASRVENSADSVMAVLDGDATSADVHGDAHACTIALQTLRSVGPRSLQCTLYFDNLYGYATQLHRIASAWDSSTANA